MAQAKAIQVNGSTQTHSLHAGSDVEYGAWPKASPDSAA